MILFAPLALMAATAAPVDCDNALTQQAMNACAAQQFATADKALNAQWKVTSDAAKRRDAAMRGRADGRPGHFATLLEAQRAWLKYRDGHCASAGNLYRGGSMEPLVVGNCRMRLTELRTQELRDLVSAEG